MRPSFIIIPHAIYVNIFFRREGVLQGQVESCELCGMQPRMVGTMCIACDRLVCVGPRLKELNVDGSMFKNRKFPAFTLIDALF